MILLGLPVLQRKKLAFDQGCHAYAPRSSCVVSHVSVLRVAQKGSFPHTNVSLLFFCCCQVRRAGHSAARRRHLAPFWKDEWEKHGACAACVEGLNSPLRYFQTCLKLRQRFAMDKALDAAGIRPSCQRPYKLAEVLDALLPLIGDKSEIQCVKDHKMKKPTSRSLFQEREVWFQVKIRLSRNLTVGCDRHGDDADDVWERGASKGHPCPAQGTFYFFPIDHQRPMQPCG
ncbi:ribonuclease T2-like isoform X3 [Phycodurus eques]|uniref:ribonuclease T2-like isoform X3 n=1 Tax=Phycodurus eques TaxID=693459 RepID=UPI002ACDAC5C|nr:ribonuclease T2-like isoform X3 [Phycodurus eques]